MEETAQSPDSNGGRRERCSGYSDLTHMLRHEHTQTNTCAFWKGKQCSVNFYGIAQNYPRSQMSAHGKTACKVWSAHSMASYAAL